MKRVGDGIVLTALLMAAPLAAWALPGPMVTGREATSAGGGPPRAGAAGTVVCSDPYDPNESCSGPLTTLGSGTYLGLQASGFYDTGDADWFLVHLRRNEKLTATATFTVPAGDAEVGLLATCGGPVLADERSAGAVHQIVYVNTGADADFRLVAGHYDVGVCRTYDLGIAITCTDAFEPNETCAGATPILPGSYPGLYAAWQGVDPDVYRITVPRSVRLVVDLAFTHSLGDVDMDLFATCPFTTTLTGSYGVTNTEHMEYLNDGPTTDWYIQVRNLNNTCNTYDMTVQLVPTANLDNTPTYAGWAAPVVVRNAAGATAGSVPATPTLDGNTADTYGNWSFQQTGAYNVPAYTYMLLLDDSPVLAGAFGGPVGAANYAVLNAGPYLVRGGRHTTMSYSDPYGEVAETNEADNSYAVQNVWSPFPTTFESPNLRVVPPPTGSGPYPNSDGFAFTRAGGYAWVVSCAPRTVGDDYDLYVYDDYSGSSAGYSNLVRASTWGLNATDFVVGHYSGTPLTVYPAVTRWAAGVGDPFPMDQSDARFRNAPSSSTNYAWNSQVLAGDRLADVYEVNMTSGTTYYFSLRRWAGPSSLELEVFPGTVGLVHSRGGGTVGATLSPAIRTLAFTASVSGWHPIVVYRSDGTASDQPVTYDLRFSTSGLVDVPGGEGAQPELAFSGAQPNPLPGHGRFDFVLPHAGRAALGLYDVHGRIVRQLADATFGAGRQTVAWDGRATDGERVGAGIYWARLEAAGRTLTRRVVMLP